MTPRLSIRHLTKRFGNLVAVDDVSLDAAPGEVHCLLGENGAGKSTLSHCLCGLLRPDEGEILIDGRPLDLHAPDAALAAGVGIVHQHFMLVPSFTVLENIMVGATSGWRLGAAEARARIKTLCSRHGVALDPDRLAGDLSVGEQQWVEIVKALYLDVRLLLLDEPTAALTPTESEKLFGIIRKLANAGVSILLISHKMHEVMQSDRVSVLRKGRLVGTLATADATRAELTRMTIGRDIDEPINRAGAPGEQTVLSLQDVTLRRRRGRPALEGVSFDLHEGEILGLAGIAGNGQSELLETIAGLRRPSSGEIRLAGKPTDDLSPRRIADLGLGHVPNDRLADGLAPALSIADNLILGQQWRRPYRRGVVLDGACIEARARDAIEQYDIAAPGHATPVRRLSGGNAQKVILAREFAKAKNCLLAHQPTRGLDVGVVDYVHGELLRLRADGVAILLVSEELEELFALADRIGVMFEGRLLDVFPREEADVQTIGQLMAGFREMVST